MAPQRKIVKIVSNQGGKKKLAVHGGSWKVAYADFVTAMMAFFLLLWILSMVPKDTLRVLEGYFQSDKTPVKESMRDFNLPRTQGEEQQTIPLTEEQRAHFAIATRLKKIIMEDPQVKNSSGISTDDLGVLLRVNNNAMFQPGSAVLLDSAKRALDEVVEVLKTYNLYLVIRGHADQAEVTPGSPYPSAWELSGARAAAAARYILEQSKALPHRIRAIAYADTRPLVPSSQVKDAVQNRRVEFYFHRPEIMSYKVVY
jgi:chemotaxis protein MotB